MPQRYYCFVFVALLAAALGAAPCYTAVLEAAGDAITSAAGDAAPVPAWHFNARTLHAATLVTGDAEALLLAAYAAAPGALVLERYALATGALLDSVALARPASAPAPAKMCATAYDVYLLEPDGTLAHYARTTGAAAPLAATAPAPVRDIACTTTRLFAAAGAAVLELDPADALPTGLALMLPAVRALAARPDNTLVLQLGAPVAYAVVYDLGARAVTAFNRAAAPVAADAGAAWGCAVTALTPETGVADARRLPLAGPCAALTPNASVLAAEGLVWTRAPGAAPEPAGGGALLNGGNLVAAAALVGDAAQADLFTAVAPDGAVAVLRYAAATGRLTLVRRAPSLAGVRPLTLLGASAAGVAWRDAAGTVWGRPGSGADLALPPLGGAVFDARWRDGGALCVLMASEVQCFDAGTGGGAVRSTAVLPSTLRGRAQGLALAELGGELALATVEAEALTVYDAAPSAIAELCAVPLHRSPAVAVAQVDAPLAAGVLALRLDASPGEVLALALDNCTVSLGAVLHRPDAAAVAFAAGPAGPCLLAAPARRRPRPVPAWPFQTVGALVLACVCCACLPLILWNVARATVIKRRGGKSSACWRATRSVLRMAKSRLCCCLPFGAYNALSDLIDDDPVDQPLTPIPYPVDDGVYTGGNIGSLLSDTDVAGSPAAAARVSSPAASVPGGGSYYTPDRAGSPTTAGAPFETVLLDARAANGPASRSGY